MSPPDLIPLNRSEHLYWAGEGHLGPINQPYVLRLSGPVDEAQVRQALRELTNAFPRLRAVIEPGPWLDRLRILKMSVAGFLMVTFVTLRATLGEQKGAFLIPQGAVQRDTASAYAMVIGKDGNVARKNITAQQAIGANWLVTDGLAAGDQVIVEGLQKVKEGAPAKGVTAEQAAAAKAAQAKPAPAPGKAE